MDTNKIQKIWKVVKTIIEIILSALGGALLENHTEMLGTFISNF